MISTKLIKGSNDESQISVMVVAPDDGNVKGIVYFAHGVTEYAARHVELFEHLAKNGFLVVANDQMGHGQSTSKASTYFTGTEDKSGWDCAVEDGFKIIEIMKEQYPDVPVHGIGFSLGSFLIRSMVIKYHYLFTTVTLIGTGYQSKMTTRIGQIIAKSQCRKVGEMNSSPLIDSMSFDNYNKHFSQDENSDESDKEKRAAWLVADKEARKAYANDPKVTAGFSTGLFFELLKAMQYTCDEKNIAKLRTQCPVLILAGTDDATGDFTKGVDALERLYRKHGLRVNKIFYKDARHDILHESCREKVYHDITDFLNKNN